MLDRLVDQHTSGVVLPSDELLLLSNGSLVLQPVAVVLLFLEFLDPLAEGQGDWVDGGLREVVGIGEGFVVLHVLY